MQPTTPAERIVVLDVLRGFALFGILLMNIEGFAGPLAAAMSGLDPKWSGVDRVADGLVYILVQGKFYTLFSLLFGIGFALMSQRAERNGRNFVGFYLRRSVGLLGFGLAHALLLWSGDVLISYALLAPLLLPMRALPVRWLPVLALFFYLSSSVMVLLFAAMGSLLQLDQLAGPQWQQAVQAAGQAALDAIELQRQVYSAGSYAQAIMQRWHDLHESLQGLLLNAPVIFGMFMLGAWFVRSGVIAAPHQHVRLFALLRWGAWPFGLLLMLASFGLMPWFDPFRMDLTMAAAYALAALAGLLMCLGYLAWVLHFCNSLRWLAAAGRMALTNYLMQSLLCTLVFYGYGLGYFEQLSRAWQIPFTLAVFLLQVVISQLWLHYFSYGPLEWLWRGFSYMKLPRLRRRAA